MGWKRVKSEREFLNNLRYVDDIVLIAKNSRELEEMVEELIRKSKEAGLTINTNKTKILGRGEKKNINIGGVTIEEVDEIQYLGQIVSFQNRREKEIQGDPFKMSQMSGVVPCKRRF